MKFASDRVVRHQSSQKEKMKRNELSHPEGVDFGQSEKKLMIV